MINEERVKELYAISKYESTDERKNRQMGQFYRADYIWKELIKSFFTGTIAYGLMFLLWVLCHQTEIPSLMNGGKLLNLAMNTIVLYLIFLIVYLFWTYVVFQLRFSRGRKGLKKYYGHLKRVNQMYNRDEKLRQNQG